MELERKMDWYGDGHLVSELLHTELTHSNLLPCNVLNRSQKIERYIEIEREMDWYGDGHLVSSAHSFQSLSF